VGALERPDPLDLEDVDLSPTMLGLDEPEEGDIPCPCPASNGCIICGHRLGGDCVGEDEG
jgi:hypothetical protein